jgi:integrase
MARAINRLNSRRVQTISEPGRHADGGGLYLVVDQNGSRRWSFMYKRVGKTSEMGLGGLVSVPLVRARELGAECRTLLAAGVDPIVHRRTSQTKQIGIPTFGEFADKFVDDMAPQWANAKHVAQWRMTLLKYAASMRGRPISEVDTNDVVVALKPIWSKKPETAARLRGRIERVLDAAKVKGLRAGENPARWRGHLSHLLPKRSKVSRGHHAALPYHDVPAFIARLRDTPSMAVLALEFTILTATRTGDTLGAEWSEVDLEARLWTIPAARMKAKREHRVPLVSRVVELLREVKSTAHLEPASGFVFRGQRAGKPLSIMAMEMGAAACR